MGGAEAVLRRIGVAWILIALAALWLGAGGAGAQSRPMAIPSGPLPPAYTHKGSPATPDPIAGIRPIPQSPFMAGNGLSEIHDDEWQSDIYTWGGPLDRKAHTFSNYLATSGTPSIGRDCGSITFDSRGRVISICISIGGPELYMFDPQTLATLATFKLPARTPEDLLLNPGFKIFQDFSAGGYFYLNNHDDVVTSTTNQHIYVIGETAGPGFKLLHDYSLTAGLRTNEEITSQLPDSHGLLWFTARQDGVVGTLNFRSGKIHVVRLGSGANGEITKSLATDSSGGVYIPTNHKLYRFVAGPGGVPTISWSIRYPNDGVSKPGQLDAGTGTTPVISGPYVGINDNANPMDVVIYRRAVHPTGFVRRHGRLRRVALPRQVCRVPVFHKNASADENAMIAAGRSYLIENNYGYTRPAAAGAQVSDPGFARVDVNRDGTGCRLVWTNWTAQAPTVVSKMSLANGLIYTYTTNRHDKANPWYWTALDYRTGRIVYETLAGTGLAYNNNYSGIAINRSGTEYVGALGGILALRDGARAPRPAHGGHHRRPSRRPRRRHRKGFTG
jgi:hypothetical protein